MARGFGVADEGDLGFVEEGVVLGSGVSRRILGAEGDRRATNPSAAWPRRH